MPDLSFRVGAVRVVPFAAAPTLAFDLDVRNGVPDERIHTVMLRCQLRIEASRRTYAAIEQTRLRDLFGEPERWGTTVRSLLWTHVTAVVPPFTGGTRISLEVPASFDFSVAVTKYLDGLDNGLIPLIFLFSGSVFYEDGIGSLQVFPVSWEAEAEYPLPVSTWRGLIDTYYPNTAWFTLRRDVFDRLHAYKTLNGIPTWEEALDRLLPVGETVEAR